MMLALVDARGSGAGMLTVGTIGRLRRACFIDGKPIRRIVRELRGLRGLRVSRKTVRKAVRATATGFRYARRVQPPDESPDLRLQHLLAPPGRAPVACTPAAGWEKGRVGNRVGDLRERLFTPRLRFVSYAELNAWLVDRCIAHARAPVRARRRTRR